MNLRLAAFGRLKQIWVAYVGLGVTALMGLAGTAAMIEMIYHLQLNAATGPEVVFAGIALNVTSFNCWFGSAFVMLTGFGLFELARRQYVHDWDDTQVSHDPAHVYGLLTHPSVPPLTAAVVMAQRLPQADGKALITTLGTTATTDTLIRFDPAAGSQNQLFSVILPPASRA